MTQPDSSPQIIVFGSLNMDLMVRVARAPRGGETLRGQAFMANPGGKGANQAVACARQGATVAMVGCVGQDDFGNTYYEARDDKDSYDVGRKRRWVIYNGYAEASKVPPDWHGWLRYTFDEPPTIAPLPRQSWEKEHRPNLTGTVYAWRPKGSIAGDGQRDKATGDYLPWTPE